MALIFTPEKAPRAKFGPEEGAAESKMRENLALAWTYRKVKGVKRGSREAAIARFRVAVTGRGLSPSSDMRGL
jgi:hypothetical protein